MLTADDASRDGGKIKYSMGVGRESLYRFLQGCLEDGRREVVRLQEYIRKPQLQFDYCPYGDTLEMEFTHANRDDYFGKIPTSGLQSAVILVDPDNGLEVKTSRPGNLHKYIKYSEARDLLNRMSRDSVLVLYQHLAHVQREEYLTELHSRIHEKLGCPAPISIVDSQVALVMMAKHATGRRRIEKAVSEFLRCNLMQNGL